MERKKKYIAIVLFLLIGLMLFVFINLVKEQFGFKKGDENNIEEVTDKKDDNDDTLKPDEEKTNEEINNNQDNQVIVPVSNNGYTKALAAVKKAEKTLSTKDVALSRNLINLVTDNNLKNQLTKRVNIVEETIDTIALVKELEKLVNGSKNKDEIDVARNIRTDKKVVEKVEKLRNKTVKTELSSRLNILGKLLNDREAPVITGINNNEVTKEDVALTIIDAADNKYKVTVDGAETEYRDTFTTDGVYKVTVVDEAFNEQTITFTVDKTAPEFDNLTSDTYYDFITVSVNDATKTKITVKNMDTGDITEIENNTVLKDDGTYYITAEDAAGNIATITAIIDNTAPIISVVDEIISTNKIVNVSDKFLTSIVIDDKEYTKADFKFVSDNKTFTFEKKITSVGRHTVVATDQKGNKTTKTIIINKNWSNFDPAPVLTIDIKNSVGKNGFYSKIAIKATDNAYLDYYIINEETSLTISDLTTSDSRTFEGEPLKEGKNTIAVYDKNGNRSNIIEFIFDKTSPTAEVTTSNNGVLTNRDVTVTLTANEALQELDGWTKVDDMTFTKPYSENGTYEITIKDLAGNTALVSVTIAGIEKEAPVFAGIENDGLSNGPVTVTVTDENLKEVKANNKADADFLSTKSKEFTTPGTYKLVATDLAGNSTTHTFTIAITKAEDFLSTLKANKKVVLGSDIELKSILKFTGSKTIDLNEHDIIFPENTYFQVGKGNKVTITGKGTIKKLGEDAAAFLMNGAIAASSRSIVLNIEKDVTVEADMAVMVDKKNYLGVQVNVDGHLKAGSAALYVNGEAKAIKPKASPLFNLNQNAVIESTNGTAIYSAGYAIWNVNGATIEGAASGIAMKAGVLNVNSGTIRATGPDQTPTEGRGDGVNPSGAAIQIESNSGYPGQIEINIAGGNIVSDNGISIYEYLDSETAATSVKSLKVTGGNFTAGTDKSNILVSDEFNNAIGKFITGGTFNADPSNFVAEDRPVTLDNGIYKVGLEAALNKEEPNILKFIIGNLY